MQTLIGHIYYFTLVALGLICSIFCCGQVEVLRFYYLWKGVVHLPFFYLLCLLWSNLLCLAVSELGPLRIRRITRFLCFPGMALSICIVIAQSNEDWRFPSLHVFPFVSLMIQRFGMESWIGLLILLTAVYFITSGLRLCLVRRPASSLSS
jgi:hypothetical protein